MGPLGMLAGTAAIQSAFNSASGLLGAALQGRQQRKNMKLQQQYNTQNMATQHGYELENMAQQQQYWQQQFNAQNERENYLLANQDALKVQSLRNAGLNPAFANGTQTLGQLPSPSAPTGGSSASAQAGLSQAGMPNLGQLDLSTMMLQQQQGDAAMVSAFGNFLGAAAQADLNPYKALESIGNFLNSTSNASYTKELATTAQALRPHQVNQLISDIDLKDAQTAYNKALEKSTLEKLPYEIKQTIVSIDLLNEQIKTEGAKRHNLAAQAAMFFASVDELMTRANLNAAESARVWNAANNAVLEGNILEFQKEMYEAFPPSDRVAYEKFEKVITMGSDVVGSLGSLGLGIGVAGKVFGGAKAIKIAGFGR